MKLAVNQPDSASLIEQHREEILSIVLHAGCLSPKQLTSLVDVRGSKCADLRILVEPSAKANPFKVGQIERQLQALLGIPVDVVTPWDIPEIFVRQVMREAIPI